jgi:adenylate kinase family enzyme
MRKFVVMGPQGCGKGTQAKLLIKDFDLVHISVGDIFRWHVQSHTKLGARVKRIVATGQLVPDDLVDDVHNIDRNDTTTKIQVSGSGSSFSNRNKVWGTFSMDWMAALPE